MTGVHPCCVLLHSSSVCTRGVQDDEISAKNQETKQTKRKKQPNYTLLLYVYVGEIILDGKLSRCIQICQGPSVVLPPSPKMPHLLLFRVEMATHSIKHPHTDTNSQKIKTQWSVKDRRTEELDKEKQSNMERRHQVTGYALRIFFS